MWARWISGGAAVCRRTAIRRRPIFPAGRSWRPASAGPQPALRGGLSDVVPDQASRSASIASNAVRVFAAACRTVRPSPWPRRWTRSAGRSHRGEGVGPARSPRLALTARPAGAGHRMTAAGGRADPGQPPTAPCPHARHHQDRRRLPSPRRRGVQLARLRLDLE